MPKKTFEQGSRAGERPVPEVSQERKRTDPFAPTPVRPIRKGVAPPLGQGDRVRPMPKPDLPRAPVDPASRYPGNWQEGQQPRRTTAPKAKARKTSARQRAYSAQPAKDKWKGIAPGWEKEFGMTKDQLKGKPTRSGYPGGEGNTAGSFTKRHFIDKAPFAKLKTKTPIKIKPIPKIKPARIGSRVKDARKAAMGRNKAKIPGGAGTAAGFLKKAIKKAGPSLKTIPGPTLKQRKGRKAVPIPGTKGTRRKAVPIPGAKGERRKASPIQEALPRNEPGGSVRIPETQSGYITDTIEKRRKGK